MSQDLIYYLEPSHYDFDEYLPWACCQLGVYNLIGITKIQQSKDDVKTNQPKPKPIVKSFVCDRNKKCLVTNIDCGTNIDATDVIKITTIYDQADNLIQLKFNNNETTLTTIFKVINLIIKFQNNLTNVTINSALTKDGIHEVSKWLALTNITELCLDDTAVYDGNYDSLLERGCVKHLSLARCKIDDDVLKRLVSKLAYPLPGSKTLTILKLSSNKITDVGAKHLAEALKTNRQLAYLNLSDNNITDDGFMAILDILQEFPVTKEEILASKSRHVNYLREKNKIIAQMTSELLADFDSTSLKSAKSLKKSVKSASIITNNSIRKNKINKFLVTINDETNQINNELSWKGKLKAIAEQRIGKFVDPFCSENVYYKDDLYYCQGNNNLAYINISYNDISYVSVKRLWEVLIKQKTLNRNPRGLVNISVEGNYLPNNCREMNDICEILKENLVLSSVKKITKRSRSIKSESSLLRSA